MAVPSDVAQLRRDILALRVQNVEFKHFVPEESLASLITKDRVAEIVSQSVPFESSDEVISFIVNGARKIFSILVLIDSVRLIHGFITRDQMQRRPIDNLLPLHIDALRATLSDGIVINLFYEKQWEFCAPVFLKEIMPRALEVPTVLPYLTDTPLTSGAYGTVYKIMIHPRHQPDGYNHNEEFVRKELELHDKTYNNEVRILSMLQRSKHPNILKMLACYTHKNKHNIISPYITGGTLQTFLHREREPTQTQPETFYMLSGLTSAIWALHEIYNGDRTANFKGLHKDLRPANILYDGNRLILADFGLSSIKSTGEQSNTPFKGRVDYYQAPECADLGPPYKEYEVTRATDIFALGCIILDVIVHHAKGPAGLELFHKSRSFVVGPLKYHLYHEGSGLNKVVSDILHEMLKQDHSASLRDVAELITRMLDIDPRKRPTGKMVTTSLYAITAMAFTEDLDRLFENVNYVPEALVEHARFISWKRSFEAAYYASLPASAGIGTFNLIVDAFRQIEIALRDINQDAIVLDSRALFQVRQLITELLDILPEDGRTKARTELETIILKSVMPSISDPIYNKLRSAFSETQIANMVDTKRMVVQVEHNTEVLGDHNWELVPGHRNLRLSYLGQVGKYKIAKVIGRSQSRVVLEETIQYQDHLRRSKLKPRVHALCDLLANKNLPKELRVPPLYGLYDDKHSFSFGLLYDLPQSLETMLGHPKITGLHDLFTIGQHSERPCLEARLGLAANLAQSLAAFHDVDWYHKDLTSHSVLFMPSDEPITECINEPYLVGFQYSRGASEDFSEGPLQDRAHCRYHEPRYLNMENRQFKDFRPEYDYYSLGILLLEIAFWETVEVIMRDYACENNLAFSKAIVETKLSRLRFIMGTGYATIVQRCLTGFFDKDRVMEEQGVPPNARVNLLFKETVVVPLNSLSAQFGKIEASGLDIEREAGRKRKNPFGDDEASVFTKKIAL